MLKELVIKVDNSSVHLNGALVVPIQQTNFPITHCRFRTFGDIFWKAELRDYNPETHCLKLKVCDYAPVETNNFSRQTTTKKIERIAFEKFDWPLLERHLSSYQKVKMIELLNNHDTNLFFRATPVKPPESFVNESNNETDAYPTFSEETVTVSSYQEIRKPVHETHRIDFTINYTEAQFRLGYIAFTKFIKPIGNKVDFTIQNDCILPEFEHIKSWFAKILKTKKFTVNAVIHTTDDKITRVDATSTQINRINEELIESIKYQRTLALTKPPVITQPDKSLFTEDEIFGEMEPDDTQGNIFQQDSEDILRFLLDNSKTRNRKQLEYLAGSKQSSNSKLRFTLHPNFGFLFLIEGKENNHFVWELLNSHATYIWSTGKSKRALALQYKRIEDLINTIRNTGREQYKQNYRQHFHDSDLLFYALEHKDISSDFKDGFVRWKHLLNERLT